MGAAMSDNFLLSPYYYSVLTREKTPPGGTRGAGGAGAGGVTNQFPNAPPGAFGSLADSGEDFDSNLRIYKAMELVKLLATKKCDVRFLAAIYKRWEEDTELEMDCFKERALMDFLEQDCGSSQWWVGDIS